MYKQWCRSFWIVGLGSLFSTVALAGVYRCVGAEGIIEFQDKHCLNSLEAEQFLPYPYQRTSTKTVHLSEKRLQKTQKKVAQLSQQQARKNARQQKQLQKERLRARRNAQHCLKTTEKIKTIDSRLRLGCKLRSCQRLKIEREAYETRKRHYCSSVR